MKKYILLLIFPILSFGQSYSTYYGTHNVNINSNSNVNINKNVNVSGNVNQTIKTIDYGALANANALKEKNRIESLKLANQQEKEAMLAIASDPYQAYVYGSPNTINLNRDYYKERGFRRPVFSGVIPHSSLFTYVGNNNWNLENRSQENILCQISCGEFTNLGAIVKDEDHPLYETAIFIGNNGIQVYSQCTKTGLIPVGELGNPDELFIHKCDISRCTVYGQQGFLQTTIYEDAYGKYIRDTYMALDNQGVLYEVWVFYNAEKSVTFEALEGRRYYLKRLVDQTIATFQFSYK